MARTVTLTIVVALLALASLQACRSTEKAEESVEVPAEPELLEETVPGELLVLPDGDGGLVILDAEGRELIAARFDDSGECLAETVRLFGMTAEELQALGEAASMSDFMNESTASSLGALRAADVRGDYAAGFVESEAEQEAATALLGALGSITVALNDGPLGLAREDHCTWSPEFFPESCAAHDECYAACNGSGARTRLQCDDEFLADMKEEGGFWSRPFAYIYYSAVRAFGWKFWPCG